MPNFDMFIKQNVNISFNNQTKEYKVVILSNNPVLFYEAWDKTKTTTIRYAIENSLEDLVKDVVIYDENHSIKYTPTTVVDFGDSVHTLILTKMMTDMCGNTVFYFKKNSVIFVGKSQPDSRSELPYGTFLNVRFDIDSLHQSHWYNLKRPHYHKGKLVKN